MLSLVGLNEIVSVSSTKLGRKEGTRRKIELTKKKTMTLLIWKRYSIMKLAKSIKSELELVQKLRGY